MSVNSNVTNTFVVRETGNPQLDRVQFDVKRALDALTLGINTNGQGLTLGNAIASAVDRPTSGNATLYVDSKQKALKTLDDAGYLHGNAVNVATTAQTPTAATRTYLDGSKLIMGTRKMQVGTMFRWCWNMTKTAAGVAASTIDIAVGGFGTVTDTAVLSFTKPAGTAVADEAWCELFMVVRGPVSTQATAFGEFTMIHNGNNVGHAVIPTVVVKASTTTLNIDSNDLCVGVCLTSGAADAITIDMLKAECWNI